MNDSMQQRPAWLAHLAEEDFHFLRRFLLCSGSLKDLAAEYGVSYPTVRGPLGPSHRQGARGGRLAQAPTLWNKSCASLSPMGR